MWTRALCRCWRQTTCQDCFFPLTLHGALEHVEQKTLLHTPHIFKLFAAYFTLFSQAHLSLQERNVVFISSFFWAFFLHFSSFPRSFCFMVFILINISCPHIESQSCVKHLISDLPCVLFVVLIHLWWVAFLGSNSFSMEGDLQFDLDW